MPDNKYPKLYSPKIYKKLIPTGEKKTAKYIGFMQGGDKIKIPFVGEDVLVKFEIQTGCSGREMLFVDADGRAYIEP